jgi:hypothetical protein
MPTILGGDITIDYLDDNRQKRISWSGGATDTRSVNEVYSACNDHMDEPTQSDDATVFSAETPVEYTIGTIDAGDKEPWYITYECIQHLTGGSIKTANWDRVEGSNTGIVIVPVTSAGRTIVAADIGYDMTHADGDVGTLLEIIDLGETNDYLVIRPDTNAAANSFDNTTGTITSGRGAFTATQALASTTGEQIWANLYNNTPVDADTHVYIYQGVVDGAARARIEDITVNGEDWWLEGDFDRLYYIRDWKTDTNPVIDSGYLTAFVRKGNTLYDSFEVQTSTTSGGRIPVPLVAEADGNQTTGYQSITFTAAAGNWSVGDEMEGDTSGARGIITQIVNPGSTQTVHYYLIGDPQTTFQTASETLTNNDDTGTGTKDGSAPAAEGPALASWFTNNVAPTITHANTTVDIDDDATAEGWGVTLDCNQNPLVEVYEWVKYITRNGEISAGDTDGIEAEQYVGCTVYLAYTGVHAGDLAEGDYVTQETSGASGIIVSFDTANKQILLRDTRGTFATHATLETLTNASTGTVEIDSVADNFNAIKKSPFGTFAGGTFFGARGVVLADWIAASDENSFTLIDSEGITRARPQAYTVTVSNAVGTDETTQTDDLVTAWRLTGAGGEIDKTEYSAAGGEAIGDATLVVDGAISTDTPGKTTGGILRIRDNDDNNQEYRLRYSSWSSSTFTLANIDIVAADAATTTTIQETGAFTNAKRGDLVLNKTQSNAVSYIIEVTDNDNVIISPPISGQTTGDAIEINAIPVVVDTADDVYVPLLDLYPVSSAPSVSIVVGSTIYYRVRVRNVRATTKIKTFVTDDAITGANRDVPVIRNPDTIHT